MFCCKQKFEFYIGAHKDEFFANNRIYCVKLNEYLPQIRSGYNVQFMFYLGWSIKRCKIEIC